MAKASIKISKRGRMATDPDTGSYIQVTAPNTFQGEGKLNLQSSGETIDPNDIDPVATARLNGASTQAAPVQASSSGTQLPADFQRDVEEYRASPGIKSFDQFVREKNGTEGSGVGATLKDLFDVGTQFMSNRPVELGGYNSGAPGVVGKLALSAGETGGGALLGGPAGAAAGFLGSPVGAMFERALYGATGGDQNADAVRRWQEEKTAQPSSLGDLFSAKTMKDLGSGALNLATGGPSVWGPALREILNPENVLTNAVGAGGGLAVGAIPRVAEMAPLVKAATQAAANAGSNAAASGISSPSSQGFDPVAAAQGAGMGVMSELGLAGLRKATGGLRAKSNAVQVDAPNPPPTDIDWYSQSDLSQRHPDVSERDVKTFNDANQELSGTSPTNGYDLLKNQNSATRRALDPSGWGRGGNADVKKSLAAQLMMSDDLKPAAMQFSQQYDDLAAAGSSKVKGIDKTTYIANRLLEADPAVLGVPEQPALKLSPDQSSALKAKALKAGADMSGMTKTEVSDAANAYRKLQLAGEDVSGLEPLDNRPEAFAKWSQSKLSSRQTAKASEADIKAAQKEVADANEAAAANRRGETYLRMMDPKDASLPVSSDFKLSPDAMMEAASAASERAKAGDYSGMGIMGTAFKDPKLALAVVGVAGNDDLPLAQKRAIINDLVKQAQTAATPAVPDLQPSGTSPDAAQAAPEPTPSPTEPQAQTAPDEAALRSQDLQAILTSNEPEADRARMVLDEAWDDPKLKQYLATVEGVDPKDLDMATRQSLLKGAQKLTSNARDRISKQLVGHLPDIQQLFR